MADAADPVRQILSNAGFVVRDDAWQHSDLPGFGLKNSALQISDMQRALTATRLVQTHWQQPSRYAPMASPASGFSASRGPING